MAPSNIYLDLTREFNSGRTRAVVCSGQAVVLHRLAIMSKDGDWVLRDDEEALSHVLRVLAARGAGYRFGAPLDLRWLREGWSAHLEFRHGPLRVRTDFFTRPPRLSPEELDRLWHDSEGCEIPYVNLRHLALLKRTNREKDYAVIGGIARRMTDPSERILFSRSARDLLGCLRETPDLYREIAALRPALSAASVGLEALETALDRERRDLMHENERRLMRYERASRAWREAWPDVSRLMEGIGLLAAHDLLQDRAAGVLPFTPGERDEN
ncbi:MAG: hypothetical protein KA419_02130 [Acidobacteria bacterium]|nr:hypothetical protein [Acidobacteriota bacterium]